MTGAAEAVIVGAEIAAGHDGQAELVVQVRHENGVVAPVVLDAGAAFALMEGAGRSELTALVGRPWRAVLAETFLGGS